MAKPQWTEVTAGIVKILTAIAVLIKLLLNE